MYDVVIIGAGPAGSTLARLIGHRARVLLVDRRDPTDTSRLPKTCGGLLAPAAQRELARQGLGIPGSVVDGPQLFAVRTSDMAARLERLYQRHYVSVDRAAFDRWLLSLVPGCVDKAFGWRITGIDPEGAGPIVRFETPGSGTASVRARLVVGADGAASAVRSLTWPDAPGPPRYTAVQGAFLAAHDEPHFGAVFDAELTDHYGWTVPKGDILLAGIAVPCHVPALPRYERFVEQLRANGASLGFELSRAAAPLLRPARARDIRLGVADVMLVGEAAGLISPSSAEGISYALRSGAAAAAAVAEGGVEGAVGRYVIHARPLAFEVLGKVAKAQAISSPHVRHLVMRSGVGAIRPDSDCGYGAALTELLAP